MSDMEKNKKGFLNDWWRQFLTGVMGTAIGVGLTFAVSNWVEGNKKEQIQRQTAIMAVYDIDEIIRELKEDLEIENTLYPIAYSLSIHPGKLDLVSADSVRQAVGYLIEETTTVPDWAADTKEKAFTGSMDVWQNLENSQFYDNVQKCYQLRAELLRIVERDVVFRHPLTEADVEKFLEKASASDLEYDGSLTFNALRKLLKQTYGKPETLRYLRMYLLRSNEYNQYINELSRLNKENKFLMSLSDEEMEAYIRRNVQKTKSATPALLAGLWEEQLNEGSEILRLRPDGALDITFHAMGNALLHDESEDVDVQIKVPVSYRLSGEWTMEGDSLRIYCPPGKGELLSIDLDKVSLAESVLKSGKEWEKSYRRSFDEYLESASVDQWYAVSFDLTGDLMFLSYPFTSPMGEVQQVRMQLVRKPDTE